MHLNYIMNRIINMRPVHFWTSSKVQWHMEFCVQQRCGRGVIKLKPTYVTVSLYLFGASIIHQSVFADELVFERVDNFNTSMAQTGGTGY